MAQMAHDGLARTIDPVHTMYDGDTVFALATGSSGKALDVTLVGTAAAHALADAVLDAVHSADSVAGVPAARDATPSDAVPEAAARRSEGSS